MSDTATKPDKLKQFRDPDLIELDCRKARCLPLLHLGKTRAELIAMVERPR